MSYTNAVLGRGEHVIHKSRVSWIVYAPCLLSVMIATALFAAVLSLTPGICRAAADNFVNVFAPGSWMAPERCLDAASRNFGDLRLRLGWVLFVPSLLLFLKAWVQRFSTEIVVTDRRLILKRGFVQRHTIEINADKVESVDVDQSLAGRLFDFGYVTIRGTGSTFERLGPVDEPLKLRTSIEAE